MENRAGLQRQYVHSLWPACEKAVPQRLKAHLDESSQRMVEVGGNNLARKLNRNPDRDLIHDADLFLFTAVLISNIMFKVYSELMRLLRFFSQ